MRFLADENCDFAVVKAPRSDGHDVAAVTEFQQRSVDRQLMEMAYNEGRILLYRGQGLWLASLRWTSGQPGRYLDSIPGGHSIHIGGGRHQTGKGAGP